MRFIRRSLQVFALVGTLIVGMMAFALVVSQTSWFRDWLRKYIVGQAEQYLNGRLSIGELNGNLFFGVRLRDVRVELDGEQVITVADIGIDYSVFEIVSQGIALDEIRLDKPVIKLARTSSGWNLGRLVKEQAREKDREGPRRPVSIGEIGISDGHFTIDDRQGSPSVDFPDDIRGFNTSLKFAYEPVRFSIGVNRLAFEASGPQFSLKQFSGDIAVADDEVFLDGVKMVTGESRINIDGVVEQYTAKPLLKFDVTADQLSVPEFARLVPALRQYQVRPALKLAARGPLDRLVLETDARMVEGNVAGTLTLDLMEPTRRVAGDLEVEHLDLAPILANPALESRLTGHAQFDLVLPGEQPGAVLNGPFRFSGPDVFFAGYRALNVKAQGRLDGRRITLDGSASAYGGFATAKGTIVTAASPAEQVALNLRGQASRVDLRRLPPQLRVPRLESNLALTYRVTGNLSNLDADVDLRRSTLEGATIADGTTVRVTRAGTRLGYAVRGSVANLNVQRLGSKLNIAALATDHYDSDLTAEFTLDGKGTSLAELSLDTSGILTDSRLFGGRIGSMRFETAVADRVLRAKASGSFADFNPATLTGNPKLDGRIAGTADATVALAGLGDPFDLSDLDVDGTIVLTDSEVAKVGIDEARITGALRDRVADLREVQLTGPVGRVEAKGIVALDDRAQSTLTYKAIGLNLPAIGEMVGRPLGGVVSLDGSVAGNRASLTTTGTLSGVNVQYDEHEALTLNSKYTLTLPELDTAQLSLKAETKATLVRLAGRELREVNAIATYKGQEVDFDAAVREETRELEAAGRVILHPDHQELHVRNLSMATQGVRWSTPPGAEATVQYGKDVVTFQNLNLMSGDQSLNVNGTLGLRPEVPGALDVKASNVDIAQVETLMLTNRGLAGRLDATARVSGSTASPSVSGEIALRNGAFKTYTFDALTGKVAYSPDGLGLDVRLQQNAQEWITARGTVPMTLFRREETERAEHVAGGAGDRVDLRVQTSTIGLGIVEGFIPQVSEVQGVMQADVQLVGSGRDPHIEGFVELKGGAFKVPFGGVAYTGLDTRLELQDDKLVIRAFQILDDHKNPLNVEGELAVHERQVGGFDVRITSDNFEVIDNDLGDVGLDVDLRMTGELRRPRIQGSVELSSARLEIDQILEQVAARQPAPKLVPLDERGLPVLDSTEPRPDGVSLVPAGSKPAPAPEPVEATGTAAPDGAQATDGDEVPTMGLFDALALDVGLSIPNNAVIRGTDLRGSADAPIGLGNLSITVGGAVGARKAPGEELRLVGRIETVRGTYEFQGRRFDILRDGHIQFQNTPDINPELDVTAHRLISGVDVRVRVRGTMRTPELELSSYPAQDQADILSLIVFNQPINQLGEGDRINLGVRASALATGFVATPLAREIGRALDLDLFEIQTSAEGGGLDPRVTVGQQLGQRLYVKFSQQFGSQEVSEFTLEYELAEFLRLQTSVAEGGSSSIGSLSRRVEKGGADLVFFFSY